MKELVKHYFIRIMCWKCSGSCDTLDNLMSKICVPKIIKNVNMKVYNKEVK